MSADRVIVVGGGLAGLAAAVRLGEAGVATVLLETRKRLGGRATSFVDPRTGETVDNCQHVALGCCTNYIDLCARLGVSDQIRWHREQYWIEAGGRESVLRPGVLPAPGHFALSFLGARFLDVGEKLTVARAMGAIARADRSAWAGRSFGSFLESHGQPGAVVAKFWSTIVASACNLAPDRVSAGIALQVFQEGFLAGSGAASIGVPRVPLVELYARAREVIEGTGGRVELGASVTRFDERSATCSDGARFEGRCVVCALPFERVGRLVAPAVAARDPRFASLTRLGHSPIIGVHLVFDRPVLSRPHAVLVGRPTHWLFRKDVSGHRVHAVISAADAWVDLEEGEIVARVLEDIRLCVPSSADAALVHARSVKERRATFAPTPGSDAHRPGAAPGAPGGVILAGDYTRTGWPATMEGATRSGYVAAALVLGADPRAILKPDHEPAPISRWLVGARRRGSAGADHV